MTTILKPKRASVKDISGAPISITTTGATPQQVTTDDVPCSGAYIRAAGDNYGVGSNTYGVLVGPQNPPLSYLVAISDVAGFPIFGISNLNQLYVQSPGGAGQTVIITPLIRV